MTPSLTSNRRRAGFTLLETALVVSLEILVAGMAVSLLFLVSEVRIRENQTEAARLATNRLPDTFRQDVQDALEINVIRQTLILVQPDSRTCTYRIQEESGVLKCLVMRWIGNEIAGQESYALPERSVAWFQRGEGEFAGMLALSIWTPPVDRHGKLIHKTLDTDALDPFTRQGDNVDSRNLANWRTVIVRIPEALLENNPPEN